jgi:nucleoside phosphorylase
VDETGAVLWEGSPLGVQSARTGTILGARRNVDDPAERARLRSVTGADAVDMESGTLARSGRLAGCIRAISDTPTQRLAGLARGAKLYGEADVIGLLHGFVREPSETFRAAAAARRALKSLEALA